MPPQPNSPPNNVFHPDRRTGRALGPKGGDAPSIRRSPDGDTSVSPWLPNNRLDSSLCNLTLDFLWVKLIISKSLDWSWILPPPFFVLSLPQKHSLCCSYLWSFASCFFNQILYTVVFNKNELVFFQIKLKHKNRRRRKEGKLKGKSLMFLFNRNDSVFFLIKLTNFLTEGKVAWKVKNQGQ